MANLQIGDKTPAFHLFDQHGEPVTLKQYKGLKLLIFFYPKANTSG